MCVCVCVCVSKNDNTSICVHLIVIGDKCQRREDIDPDYSCEDHVLEKDGNISLLLNLKQKSKC